MEDDFGNYSLKQKGLLVHNIFNINLTKFGQTDGKRGKYFFSSNLGWIVISPYLKGG